jgi:hypothetical protein
MKTTKFASAIITLSLVFFMSFASIANSGVLYTGDLPISGDKSPSISSVSVKDFSYLRFDINKYVSETEASEVIHSSLDYLRFDVTKFINDTDAETLELPLANEFEYLRFDVNNFAGSDTESIIELPGNEFDYLRFDANNYTSARNNAIDELPVTE